MGSDALNSSDDIISFKDLFIYLKYRVTVIGRESYLPPTQSFSTGCKSGLDEAKPQVRIYIHVSHARGRGVNTGASFVASKSTFAGSQPGSGAAGIQAGSQMG